MRRFLWAVLAVLAASPAFATAGGPDRWHVQGVAAGEILTVRSRPDTSARVVGHLPANARDLSNLGCNTPSFERWLAMTPAQKNAAAANRWCKVHYRGLTGWVRGRYLREAD
ncbi:SH3 domain-containing protein [Ancylobacter terrae]|uniref:SH3 domain-containing protein n=1 Tax=Ancylobacter sp. sgz301288 TaxID=3342077 RepID=UPI00385B7301